MTRLLRAALIALSLSIPSMGSADVQDLFWDRLDRLMQRDGWNMTARGDAFRRIACTNCGGVEVTISASALSPEIKSEYTARQAYRAYRIKKCRTLVQSGDGRCINESGLADIGNGVIEHETVFFYGDVIIWGHATGAKDNDFLRQSAEPLMRQLMKSLTPLY